MLNSTPCSQPEEVHTFNLPGRKFIVSIFKTRVSIWYEKNGKFECAMNQNRDGTMPFMEVDFKE